MGLYDHFKNFLLAKERKKTIKNTIYSFVNRFL